MVSPVIVDFWRRTNNLAKLREHGLIKEEPEPKLNKRERRVIRQAQQKRTKPISFRPTRANYYFLERQKDKSKTINTALTLLEQKWEEWEE